MGERGHPESHSGLAAGMVLSTRVGDKVAVLGYAIQAFYFHLLPYIVEYPEESTRTIHRGGLRPCAMHAEDSLEFFGAEP